MNTGRFEAQPIWVKFTDGAVCLTFNSKGAQRGDAIQFRMPRDQWDDIVKTIQEWKPGVPGNFMYAVDPNEKDTLSRKCRKRFVEAEP